MGAEDVEEWVPIPGAVSQMISREMFLQKFWRDWVGRACGLAMSHQVL